MVLLYIILAAVAVVGIISFKTQISDSTDISPTVGCLGITLLVAAGGLMVVLLLTQFRGDPRTLLLLVLGTGGLMAVLYSPFVSNVFGTFLTNFIYPTGGGVTKSYDIAEKLRTEGHYAEAVAEYEKAIEEDPDDVNARILLADTYCKMEQYEQAARALLELLDRDLPAQQWCYVANRLADIFAQKMADPHKAREVLKRRRCMWQ